MNDRLPHLVFQWLRQLQIPVSAGYIHEKLLSHPHYPSLLSITDTLDDLGIENAALVVDKEQLYKIYNTHSIKYREVEYGNNRYRIS